MDPRRLSAGEWIGAAGGVVLVVALFLPWYRVGGAHVNAWDSMAVDVKFGNFKGLIDFSHYSPNFNTQSAINTTQLITQTLLKTPKSA